MRNYEIMFILSTQLTDEEKQAGVAFEEETLKVAGAAEVNKKKENGYYVLTTFQADGTKFNEIETKLNINESILKYMIVKND